MKKVTLTRPATRYRQPLPVPTASSAHVRVRHGSTTTTNVVSVVDPVACAREGKKEPPRVRTRIAREEPSSLQDQVMEEMSAAEKQQLLDRLLLERNMTSSSGKSELRDIAMWSTAVHQAMVAAIGTSDGDVVGPSVIHKLLGGGASWQHVRSFMQSSKLAELTAVERQAVYYMLADLLVKYARGVARHSQIPVSAKLVGQCTSNLPGVFDKAFPGYMEAGLAHIVARQIVSK